MRARKRPKFQLKIRSVSAVAAATLLFSLNLIAANEDLSARCGYSSRADLLSTAQSIVDRFSTLQLDLLGAQKPHLKSEAPDGIIAAEINYVVAKIANSPALEIPNSAGLIEVVYNDVKGMCAGFPCAWPNSFTVVLPPDWLVAFQKLPGADFRKSMITIVGHEIGHHVYNAIFRVDSSYPRVSATGPLTPLKYHLTVDAIGLILTGGKISDTIIALSKSLALGVYEGDGRQRLECLNDLPDGK